MKPEELDSYLHLKYSGSFMNNAKWIKLLEHLTSVLGAVHLYYKLVYSDELRLTSFDAPDTEPFFIEPILYKEVEWVIFPKEYKDYVSPNNLKAGLTSYNQNIEKIEQEICSIGEFEIECSNLGLKLYGYR
ncbi:hypothetical protein LVD17_07445 [Fulvivirga ulvae]|uniref:DUF6678 family protein n=1 Tax=Fulvivirga ulvae TaxID=2904245 RepID=UPI001F362C9B|nr:DUF6678 family protein [Fulvivirga ulvae]UII33653.1 hypothetical protein LVD17_07445 [Fulvivirga ulvae]